MVLDVDDGWVIGRPLVTRVDALSAPSTCPCSAQRDRDPHRARAYATDLHRLLQGSISRKRSRGSDSRPRPGSRRARPGQAPRRWRIQSATSRIANTCSAPRRTSSSPLPEFEEARLLRHHGIAASRPRRRSRSPFGTLRAGTPGSVDGSGWTARTSVGDPLGGGFGESTARIARAGRDGALSAVSCCGAERCDPWRG